MNRKRADSKIRGLYEQKRSGVAKRNVMPNQKGRILPKSFNRGAIFRATTISISNSLSLNSELSRKRGRLIKESKATIQMGKSLGINFD